MRLLGVLLLVYASTAMAEDERILTKDISDNRRVQLVAAQHSKSRGQNLVAKFIDLDSKGHEEFCINFPAHSHTPHETTLMNIIRSCVDWKKFDDTREWHKAVAEVVFSLPKDLKKYSEHFERWFMISMAVSPPNEAPRDASPGREPETGSR